MHIGIDVGGTNTDAVLVEGSRVLAAVKTSTTEDVSSGIDAVLAALAAAHRFGPADVRAVMIGTTHFINALVEGRHLAPTAALRLGLPATASLPPLVDWPERLVAACSGTPYLVHGGHEFDGRRISDLREAEVVAAAHDMAERGIASIAVSSVFSPVSAEFEEQAAAIIARELPGVPISLSSQVGRVGLLERENATVINAALRLLADGVVAGLDASVRRAGISAPLYLSQNDGTLMDVERARAYPVATFASGPTNSMRGAAFLSGHGTCAVVDVGGTTADIGMLVHGFPREATTEVEVAGIRTNFRMPDVLSIGIGGGSLVRGAGSGGSGGPVTVGPDSVGFRLTQRALVFGGDVLTATDVAVAAGLADVGDASLVAHLDRSLVDAALARIGADVAEVVDRMRLSAEPVRVVAVGGGSILLPEELPGIGAVERPENYAVANAIGAAIAQVGGEVDRVFAVAPGQRDAVLDAAKSEAVDRAVAAGADRASTQVVDVDEVPMAYLPGGATRIRVRAVGDLVLDALAGAR